MKKWYLLLSACLLLFATACGNNETTDSATSEDGVEDPKLTVYSGRTESFIGSVVEKFEAETGIDVEIRYGGTSEMAATIFEEGDNSKVDVFYAQDPGGTGELSDAGLFAPLSTETLDQVPTRYQGENKDWIGISGRARTVVYNTDAVTADQLPADLNGFTDPIWKGKIGWAPTNGSFQAMITAMRSTWGEAETKTWLEGIIANEPVVYAKNTPIVEAVGAGEVEVGFVNHYYLHRFLAEEGDEFAARNHFLPSGGPGSLIMVSGAGIMKNAPHPKNAELFINYMLNEESQSYFATETYEYPVVDGIEIHPILQPLSELDAVAIEISLSDMADLEGTANLLTDLGLLE